MRSYMRYYGYHRLAQCGFKPGGTPGHPRRRDMIGRFPSSSGESAHPVTGARASRRKSGAIPGYNSVAPLRLTSAPQMDCYLFEGEP